MKVIELTVTDGDLLYQVYGSKRNGRWMVSRPNLNGAMPLTEEDFVRMLTTSKQVFRTWIKEITAVLEKKHDRKRTKKRSI